ncbi:hypothetical protein GOODEAATRI_017764, partial [Goodea atripinnis]
ALMMVVGFLGCCGAIKESPCMLGLVIEEVTEFYKQTFDNYKTTKQEALKETLRLIHFGVRAHTLFSLLSVQSV